MNSVTINDLADLKDFAAAILKDQENNDPATSTVIGLVGDLGVGKTALVQELAALLGVSEQVTSPTYLIMRSYTTTHAHFKTLVHIDAYRIESLSELAPLRFLEVLAQPNTLVCIEWADQIKAALPPTTLFYTLAVLTDEIRVITY